MNTACSRRCWRGVCGLAGGGHCVPYYRSGRTHALLLKHLAEACLFSMFFSAMHCLCTFTCLCLPACVHALLCMLFVPAVLLFVAACTLDYLHLPIPAMPTTCASLPA